MREIGKLMDDLRSDNDRIRFAAFQVLLPMAREAPHKIYPWWDELTAMLEKAEVSNKYYGLCLIAQAVRADGENRFDRLLPRFYALLEHESPVVAPNAAGLSGIIVRAKPHLEKEVTARLLASEHTCRCRHRELYMAYVISAFDEYFDLVSDRQGVAAFVARQRDSSSPKTRKTARDFLKKRR